MKNFQCEYICNYADFYMQMPISWICLRFEAAI